MAADSVNGRRFSFDFWASEFKPLGNRRSDDGSGAAHADALCSVKLL